MQGSAPTDKVLAEMTEWSVGVDIQGNRIGNARMDGDGCTARSACDACTHRRPVGALMSGRRRIPFHVAYVAFDESDATCNHASFW